MDQNKTMEKRYGLPTAIAMVVGTVIGSGVFIKGGKVLSLVDGNMWAAVGVIAVVGLISIICSLVFAELSAEYGKVNGVVDYADMALGKTYAYYVGWFLNTIYFPSIAATLAFFSALFACPLFGVKPIDMQNGQIAMEVVGLGAAFLMVGYAVNALSPKLAGKLQVSMTVIKLIPLLLMGIVGTVAGIANGATLDVLDYAATVNVTGSGFFNAVVAFAFSYEGWIIATSIYGELKNAKRNMPIALIVGSITCIVIYSLYIFSMSSLGDVQTIIDTWPLGENLPRIAFSNVFGRVGGTIVYVFIMISCLGTMNGLIMGSCRGMYSLALRERGPRPQFFADVDKDNGFVIKSALIGILMGGFWYGWNTIMWLQGPDFMGGVHSSMFLGWEADEISIVTLYAFYVPMLAAIMVKCKKFGFIRRFVLPMLGIACCLFMVYCCIVGKGWQQLTGYLCFFGLVMAAAWLLDRKKGKT